MRRMISLIGCALLLVSPTFAVAQEQAQKAEKQAPTQKVEPTQKAVQKPTQKVTPAQKVAQAPTQKHCQKQCQAPTQKGSRLSRLGGLRRG
jgi:predicted lipid-binding transport protein (Tim44 family)